MATYLSLTNELLRRLNEVIIDQTDFLTVRNVQAIAKDAINSSVREILQTAQEWPFTLTTYTQSCTAGTGVYDFPSDFSSVDWDSFYLKKHNTKKNQPATLDPVEYVYYSRHLRPDEDTSGVGGYNVPAYVYQTMDSKFGVSPLPDDTYEIEYRYWSVPEDLVNAEDVCTVPDRFKHIIIDGAMMYMMRFRSNEQSANIHQSKFEDGIKTMRRLLIDEPLTLRSTALNQGHKYTRYTR